MAPTPAPRAPRLARAGRPASWPPRRPARAATALLPAALLAGLLALGGCSGMFFQPDALAYYAPERFALAYEDVFFRSGDGTQLTGWFLPAQGRALGTIVFFHGNAANISNHLAFVRWLPRAGYAVFLFDYRGYGISEGEPSAGGLIEDGVAALRAVRARPDVDPQRLVVYGQSLGGAVAIGALARAGTQGVRALVVESAFGSYREEARLFMDAHWLTWVFQYPAAWLLFSDDHRAYDDLPAVAAVPFLALYSTGDDTVPPAATVRLYEAFPGPDKTLWVVEGLPHVVALLPDGSPWRARLLDYLAGKLGPLPPPAQDPIPPPLPR